MIIGLGHYSRVGKDTIADKILELTKYKFSKKPFAWELKKACFNIYSWTGLKEPLFYDEKGHEAYRDIKLKYIDLTPVELWVSFGNKMREIYKDTWIQQVLSCKDSNIVIPDVRFMNEVEAIKAKGGKVYRILRPGVEPRHTVSDRQLLNYEGWDGTFINDKFSDIEEIAKICLQV